MKSPITASYVRATLKLVKSVEVSDDPQDYHTGPDYDLYEVNVECGPEQAFLTWFCRSMLWGKNMSRVGSTNQFVDFGFTIDTGVKGHVFDFTYDEFFPVWLGASADDAKAKIANMASKALFHIAKT